MNKLFLFVLIFAVTAYASEKEYFQQEAHYTIHVNLHVPEKTYDGTEELIYINHSPDTLSQIKIHLYPNAYKNTSTPFARQKENKGSSRFYFSKQEDRGYLNLNSIESDGQKLLYTYKKGTVLDMDPAQSGTINLKYLKNQQQTSIDEITVELEKAMLPGDTLHLDMTFEGKFPEVFSRMGVYKNNHFAATQWYPKVVVYDKYGWHPDSYLEQGEFYGEYGSFDVSITLPDFFVIDATGMLQNNPAEEAFNQKIIEKTDSLLALDEKKERKKLIKKWQESTDSLNYDATKTVRFIAKNVHNFAWFTGPEYLLLHKIQPDSVMTNVLVFPENAYDWRHVPDYVRKTLYFYGKSLGAYQYPKASVVDGALSAGGGMEYPMITIISSPHLDWANILELVVMHEVGHNWFMGMLGSNERASTFLDEGMNSFIEYNYMEYYYGRRNATRFKELTWGLDLFNDLGEWDLMHLSYGTALNSRTDQPMNLRASAFSPINYGAVNYHKGIAMLRALEWYLGPESFNNGMHTYFENWNGKHPEINDFFDTMARVSGKNLDWFIAEWYSTTHYNDFKITKTKTEHNGSSYTTRVWLSNVGNMSLMPAPVHLVTAEGDTLEKRWNGDENEPVVFLSQGPADRIEVNLKREIFESSYLNNASGLPKIELNFIPQFPSFDKYQVNFFPSYWYDGRNDKSRVGFLMWTGNPITYQWFSIGNYSYGTATGKSHYGYKMSNRFYFPFANYSDITAEIRDKEGLQRYSFELSNFFKKRKAISRKTTFELAFDDINLYDPVYAEADFYEIARYSTISASLQGSDKKMLSRWNLRLDAEKSLKLFNSAFDYFKMSLEGQYKYWFGKKTFAGFHLYAGYVSAGKAPVQESVFAAGDLDPKQKSFAALRTGSLAPLNNFSFDRGMNMYSYNSVKNTFFKGRLGASFSFDLKVPYLPVLYAAGASLAEKPDQFVKQNSFFGEAGVKADIGGINFILPLYKTNPYPGEKHLAFRWMFAVGIGFSIGS